MGRRGLEFLTLALRSAGETLAYLVAYLGVPIWAFLAAGGLAALDPVRRWWPSVRGSGDPRRRAGLVRLLVDGATSLPWRDGFGDRLRNAAGHGPGGIVVFLAASHGLNAYVFFLLGPLMGKDVLLTHVAGVIVWMLVASVLLGRTGGLAGAGDGGGDESPSVGLLPALGAELKGGVPALLYGLALGSLVAAWGLGSPDLVPAEAVEPPAVAQTVNAVVGGALAALLAVPPVGNLFVATYLWKVGLAHAGLIAFLSAAPLSLVRLRTYRRILGPRGARLLGAVFFVAALVAGLVVAALWGAMDLGIRYKLVPGQMWQL